MMITTKIKMDLQNKGITPRVDAVQGDANTRALELKLYEQGKSWEVPADVTARLRYRKPDKTGGVYDTLPDGTPAWQIEGNTVTLILAPQVLSAAGPVLAQAELLSGADNLASFEIQIDVAPNVSADVIKSEDYINIQAWLLESLDTALAQAEQDGAFVPSISMGAVATLGYGSPAEAYFTGTGKAPVLNLKIPEGYTPQKGLDYYTEEEKQELQDAVTEAVRPDLIAKFQQYPKFANSTEECVDTDAVYVLPDGYLYGYMECSIAGYENLVPTSEALDSTDIYNDGLGYKDGSYISSSSGADGTKEGHAATGMIAYPVKSATQPPTIYLKGGTPDRIVYYLSDKTYKLSITVSAPKYFTIEELDEDYWKITPTMEDSGNSSLYEGQGSGGYLRFDCVCDTGADLIITLDEEIAESTETVYQWTNTGHAFVPADYEDRIISLEEETADQESRLSDLESSSDGVPAYVCEEAERVADLVLDKRNAQCICFAALSDIHYPYDDAVEDVSTAQALQHAAMGLTEIRKFLPLDFVGFFGDYVKGASDSTVAESKAALKFIRRTLYEAGLGVRQIWMQGNHDRNPYDTDDGDLTDDELYAYIFAGNAGTVDPENVHRGYGYQDFEGQKIRVIYLNSSDISGAETAGDHMWSGAQLRWLANTALDLTEKETPEEWGVVVLSHEPMNWGTVPAFTILDGYASGSSGTAAATEGETVAFDFTDVPRGEILCCVNGHTHNFRYSQTGENGIWQIAVPQVCAGRYNEYAASWPEVGGEVDENSEPVYYYKTADSAQATSFCVFLIDRKNRKIQAICYGAGIDREISY